MVISLYGSYILTRRTVTSEVEWAAKLAARARVHPTPLSKDSVPSFPGLSH